MTWITFIYCLPIALLVDMAYSYPNLTNYRRRMNMIDKRALANDLTEAFITYQHRLDFPIPSCSETRDSIIMKYNSDPIFHAKVEALVYGVMQILSKHI